jgi:hypothetical protein
MELWTGLVCLVADPACQNFKRFGDGKGAYVNVVAWAESAKHFEDRVAAIAKRDLDCIALEIEQVELLELFCSRRTAPMSFSRCEQRPIGSRMTCCLEGFTSGFKTM